VQKISPPPGFDPQTVRPIASHYTDYDTRLIIILQAFSIKRSYEDDRHKYGMLQMTKGNMQDIKT
jgi:hypothetical protein